jgi:hypothetical protein
MQYKFLNKAFLEAMNDIGRYGEKKYGNCSFAARAARGDTSRGDLERCAPAVISDHAKEHFRSYLADEPHDYFGTRKHQLAAVAFNAMLEFHFASLETEEPSAKPS